MGLSSNIDSFKHSLTQKIVGAQKMKNSNDKIDMIIYLGKQSINSFKKNINQNDMPVLGFDFNLSNKYTSSEKMSQIKILKETILSISAEFKLNRNILIILDDLEMIHEEFMGAVGLEGHQMFLSFLREIYSQCGNKQNQGSLSTLIYSNKISSNDYSKETESLKQELELLQSNQWDFDQFSRNKIFSILKQPKNLKLANSEFDGKKINQKVLNLDVFRTILTLH